MIIIRTALAPSGEGILNFSAFFYPKFKGNLKFYNFYEYRSGTMSREMWTARHSTPALPREERRQGSDKLVNFAVELIAFFIRLKPLKCCCLIE
jgi:hypothetical protein